MQVILELREDDHWYDANDNIWLCHNPEYIEKETPLTLTITKDPHRGSQLYYMDSLGFVASNPADFAAEKFDWTYWPLAQAIKHNSTQVNDLLVCYHWSITHD